MRRFLVCSLFLLAFLAPTATTAQAPAPLYAPGVLLANLDAAIKEASGIAASRRNKNIYWIHNDSGDKPFLYAVDRRGKTRGVFRVGGAKAKDWEGLACGPGADGRGAYLYVGDIGDNSRSRKEYVVYRLPEPALRSGGSGKQKKPEPTDAPTVRRRYMYPDGRHDAEALLVHPKTGIVYVVTKEESGIAGVYRFPREAKKHDSKQAAVLTKVAEIRIANEFHPYGNRVTGGDISPDGRRVVLRTYVALYEWRLPTSAANFDAIWKTKPEVIISPGMIQSEAVCYSASGASLLTTSEQRPTPLYELKRR